MRTFFRIAIACGLAAGSLAACSGGGAVTFPATPTPRQPTMPSATPMPPLKATNSGTVPVSSTGGTQTLPASTTVGGTIGFPALSSGSATTVAVTVSDMPPAGTPTLSSVVRRTAAHVARPLSIGTATTPVTALAYLSLTAAATVAFTTEPSFTLTLPAGTPTNGRSFYLALYDPTAPSAGYQADSMGPVTVASSAASLAFTGQARTTTFAANQTYTFALYSLPTPTATNLYVLDFNNTTGLQSVYEYPTASLNGTVNLPPSNTLTLTAPSALPGYFVSGIAEDAVGEIYAIASYNDTATTTAGAIVVYPPLATGNTIPARIIVGSNIVENASASDSYVDGNGNLWVNNTSAFLEFSPTASGNSAPINEVTGLNAGGIAVGQDGTLYEAEAPTSPTGAATFLRVFAPGATGNATPMTAFGGTTAAPIGGILALDSANALYTVTNAGAAVSIYPQGATAPARTIVGTATGLVGAQPVAVDPVTQNLFVANEGGVSSANAAPVVVFAPGANGNATPIATLQGSNVPIQSPHEIVVGI